MFQYFTFVVLTSCVHLEILGRGIQLQCVIYMYVGACTHIVEWKASMGQLNSIPYAPPLSVFICCCATHQSLWCM